MNRLILKLAIWIKSFRYRKCKTCTNYYNRRSFPRCPLCDAQQRFEQMWKQPAELNEGEDNRIMSAMTGKNTDRSLFGYQARGGGFSAGSKRREEDEPKRSSNEGWFQGSTGSEWYGSGNISDLGSSSSDSSPSTGYGSSSDSSSSDSGGGSDFGGGGSSDSF